jgi:hypothetical protein
VLHPAAGRLLGIGRFFVMANGKFPCVDRVCENVTGRRGSLTLIALVIAWRQEVTKEAAGDKENDPGCSAEC